MRRIHRFDQLTLLGLALVGLAAGVVSGLSVEQKAYTVQEVKVHSRTPYDLLVLPKRTGAVVGDLTDPNALDQGSGGITLAQWKAIEAVQGVAVAAPLAPLGEANIQFGAMPPALEYGASDLYRLNSSFVGVGLPSATSLYSAYWLTGASSWTWPPFWGTVVAVDPAAENRLVGLKGAVTHGAYFGIDTAMGDPQFPGVLMNVPALVASASPVFGTASISVQSLPDPYSPATTAKYVEDATLHPTEHTPLAKLHGQVVFRAAVSDSAVWKAWIDEQEGKPGPYQVGNLTFVHTAVEGLFPMLQTGSLNYARARSPYPGRWPLALQANPVPCGATNAVICEGFAATGEPFRTLTLPQYPCLTFNVVGVYSAAKLHIATDPLTGAPMVNYAPEQGQVVLSPDGKALNPPLPARPDMQPAGLFTQPPIMLVPIADVLPVLSKAPIASIRVKVKGVSTFGIAVQKQIQGVAARIRKATGLRVEMIRGASPQEVLVHPGYEKGYTKRGWIQEAWVRSGAAIEILRQTLLSQDVILVPILVAAFVFALTAGIIGVEVRRREYATLLALGVSPRSVQGSVLKRGLLYGALVAVLAFAAAVAVAGVAAIEVGALVALLSGAVIAVALAPVARATGEMEPLPSLRESSPPMARGVAPGSIVGLGLTLFLSSLRRHLAAIAALLIPGAVFYLMFLVRSALHHTMYFTSLGEYLLIRVGPLITLGAVVVIVLAILTAAQLGLHSATLRASTWAIGQALGWPMAVPVLGSLVESAVVGLVAGLVGVSLAALIGDSLFDVAFQPLLWTEAVLLIVLSGLVAAVPAAIVVSRQDPIVHLRGVGM